MLALYERFIQQVKEEHILSYNLKHRDYLIRCGKIQPEDNKQKQKNVINTNQAKTKRGIQNQQNQEIGLTKKEKTINYRQDIKSDQRPLKGAQNYNIEEHDETEFMPKQLKIEKKQRHSPKKMEETVRIQPKPAAKKQEQKQTQVLAPIAIQEKEIQQMNINQMSEFPEEQEDIVLVQCPEGCGRKFNEKAIDKHIKICQKGEKKRKVFKVKVVDQQAEKLKKKQPIIEEKSNKVPKWKKESDKLRKMIGVPVQNNANTAPVEQQDDRTQCPSCGRKFNETAAAKHIPACLNRNKMK